LYLASRWLGRRTHRVLNPGLLLAGAAAVIALAWLAVAYTGARGDLLAAQSRGSAPVEALARADIAALQAHADESLTLIDNTGDDTYQADYVSTEKALGPGAGTLLNAATAAAQGTPAEPAVQQATTDAQLWFAAHAKVRILDDNNNHPASVTSVLGTSPGDAGGAFIRLTGDLTTAVNQDQAVFNSTASSATGAYAGLAPGVAVAALVMAAACAWGRGRRQVVYH
jgi:hypothetical protein